MNHRTITALTLFASPALAGKKNKKNKKNRAEEAPVEAPVVEPPSAQTVVLQFGWPAGATAQVSFQEHGTKSSGGPPETTETTASGITTVEKNEAGGFRISTSDMTFTSNMLGEMPDSVQSAFERAVTVPNTYLVDSTGAYQGMEGGPDLVEVLTGIIDQAREHSGPEAAEMVEQIIAPMTTPEFMDSAYEGDWNNFPGFWAGEAYELEVGESFSLEHTVMTPFGTPLPGTIEFGVSEVGIPCFEGDERNLCARFWTKNVPTEEGMRSLLDAILAPVVAQFQPEAEKIAEVLSGSSISVTITTEVIAEPDGLIPWSIHTDNSTTVVMQIPEQGTVATGGTKVRDTRYRWEFPSP